MQNNCFFEEITNKENLKEAFFSHVKKTSNNFFFKYIFLFLHKLKYFIKKFDLETLLLQSEKKIVC